jgi:hypothetical protein
MSHYVTIMMMVTDVVASIQETVPNETGPGRCGKVDLYRLFNVSNYPASGSVRILISPWGGGRGSFYTHNCAHNF